MSGMPLAKITGVKACEAIRKQYGKDYVSLMPTNLYGSHDNFDLQILACIASDDCESFMRLN